MRDHKRVMICEHREVKGHEGSGDAEGFGDAPRLFRVVEESWRHGLTVHSRVRPSTPHIAVWLLRGNSRGRVDGKHGLRVRGALRGHVSERSCADGCSERNERGCQEGAEELHG